MDIIKRRSTGAETEICAGCGINISLASFLAEVNGKLVYHDDGMNHCLTPAEKASLVKAEAGFCCKLR